jgi:hypothetical protein
VTIAIDGGIGVRLVAEHLNGGYGGAVAYSLGVAVVTGSLAVLAGEITRQFFSRSLWKKLVAGVVLIAATILTLLIGLEYAQLRDAILHGHSIDGVLSGLGAVLRHPHLTGGGWLLALLTLSTAGALGHAVFESDDPIPGYGRVHRVWLAAQAALERRDHELAALRGAAAAALQQSLRLVVERAEALLEELEAIAARHTAATEQGALELAHLQRQAESELKARSALESIDGSRIQSTQFPTRLIVGSDLGSLTLGALQTIESCRLKIRESLEDFLAWFDRHVASEAKRLSQLTKDGDDK